MWKATRNLFAGPSAPVVVWAAVGIAYIFSAILPLFYLALWRNKVAVHVPKRRRWLCLAGAVAGGGVIFTQFPVKTVETLLSALATLSCVVLLVALFRSPGEVPHVSEFLGSMIPAARIGGGMWVAINVARLVLDPREGSWLTLLEQICMFAAPFALARR